VSLLLALLAVLHGVPARYHHVHYRTADPAGAMTEAATRLNGVRTIVSGLGVGVRTSDTYLLFDRLRDDEAGEPGLVFDHVAFAAADFEGAVTTLASVHRVVQRTDDSVLFDTGAMRIEIVRETETADLFWCPMHPDVRGPSAGKCPICAMDLVPIPPPRIGEYKLDLAPQRARRSGLSGLRLTVRDPETNARVTSFATVHDKLLHLFIVSSDLSSFAHLHPELRADGTFVLKHELPPGEYMLFADFLPNGGSSQMVQRAFISPGPRPAARAARPPPTQADLAATVDGVRFVLDPEAMQAGREACLTLRLTDAKTGAPIGDLESFLGAPAHMLMVRADLTDALHAHPDEIETRGPTISFHPLIPADGVYKIWVQIQRAGKVTTAPFLVTSGR
jgi:hypothetical protein